MLYSFGCNCEFKAVIYDFRPTEKQIQNRNYGLWSITSNVIIVGHSTG